MCQNFLKGLVNPEMQILPNIGALASVVTAKHMRDDHPDNLASVLKAEVWLFLQVIGHE